MLVPIILFAQVSRYMAIPKHARHIPVIWFLIMKTIKIFIHSSFDTSTAFVIFFLFD